MANATPSHLEKDPADDLAPEFKHQAKAIRGLIQSASVQQPLAAARAVPGRLEKILEALRSRGELDPNIDRTASELTLAVEALDGAIYGPGTIGEDREAKVTGVRMAADQKLNDLIDLLLRA